MTPLTPFPLQNTPALHIPQLHTLVLADIHIGIERELREGGFNIASQTQQLKTRMHQLLKDTNVDRLIILGDLKHNIPTSTKEERRGLFSLLEDLSKNVTIHLIPGNHDGAIQDKIPPNIHLQPASGMVLDSIGFTHGHRWPRPELITKTTFLISAHLHPTIVLKDRLGHQHYEPCWLRGTLQKEILTQRFETENNPTIIILPAFNPLTGGLGVNKEGLIGPIGKSLDTTQTVVYLLDGTQLGTIESLRI